MRARLLFTVALLFSAACTSALPPGPDSTDDSSSPGVVTPVSPGESADPGGSDGARGPSSLAPDEGAPTLDCEAPSRFTPIDLASLLGDPDAWDGEKIAVAGNVMPEMICTLMVCPPQAPCCNTCGFGAHMVGPAGVANGVYNWVGLDGAGCTGTSCGCTPEFSVMGFSLVWGTAHRYDDVVEIELEGSCGATSSGD